MARSPLGRFFLDLGVEVARDRPARKPRRPRGRQVPDAVPHRPAALARRPSRRRRTAVALSVTSIAATAPWAIARGRLARRGLGSCRLLARGAGIAFHPMAIIHRCARRGHCIDHGSMLEASIVRAAARRPRVPRTGSGRNIVVDRTADSPRSATAPSNGAGAWASTTCGAPGEDTRPDDGSGFGVDPESGNGPRPRARCGFRRYGRLGHPAPSWLRRRSHVGPSLGIPRKRTGRRVGSGIAFGGRRHRLRRSRPAHRLDSDVGHFRSLFPGLGYGLGVWIDVHSVGSVEGCGSMPASRETGPSASNLRVGDRRLGIWRGAHRLEACVVRDEIGVRQDWSLPGPGRTALLRPRRLPARAPPVLRATKPGPARRRQACRRRRPRLAATAAVRGWQDRGRRGTGAWSPIAPGGRGLAITDRFDPAAIFQLLQDLARDGTPRMSSMSPRVTG